MSDELAKYKKDFFLLLEAGFIAVNNKDEDSALKLFKAASLLKPESTFPKIGFGYMHLCKLELKQAVNLFEDVLRIEPQNDMAKTFLGLSLSLTPQATTQGEKVLEEMRSSSDAGIKKLANTAIDFVDRFIKKASPLIPQKKQSKSK